MFQRENTTKRESTIDFTDCQIELKEHSLKHHRRMLYFTCLKYKMLRCTEWLSQMEEGEFVISPTATHQNFMTPIGPWWTKKCSHCDSTKVCLLVTHTSKNSNGLPTYFLKDRESQKDEKARKTKKHEEGRVEKVNEDS